MSTQEFLFRSSIFLSILRKSLQLHQQTVERINLTSNYKVLGCLEFQFGTKLFQVRSLDKPLSGLNQLSSIL